jgi:hypothetical protein
MIQDLVEIARNEIGTEEDDKHTNTGSSIAKYQEATSLGGTGWPWCASFVDWCIAEYDKTNPIGIPLPKSAAAFDLIKWGNDNDLLVWGEFPFTVFNDGLPQIGDIVVYTFSHCGIVSSVEDTKGFHAIEGNTNPQGGRDGYEVAERQRPYSLVKKFIRLLKREV